MSIVKSKKGFVLGRVVDGAFIAADTEFELLTPEELRRRNATGGTLGHGGIQMGVRKITSVRNAKHPNNLAKGFDPTLLSPRS